MREYSGTQKDEMKQRLKTIASKKLDTTMIFPLGEFEKTFGFLWGHGKQDTELTNDEINNKRKWAECRDNILNNGNKQKRGLMKELDMCTVVWHGYQTVLTFKGAQE